MEEEIWKLIPNSKNDLGYASNLGRIKYNNKIVEPQDDGQGYLRCTVKGVGRNRVNVFVMKAFNGEPPIIDGKKCVVDHIDGNTKNNRLDNLQYITNSQNQLKRRKVVNSEDPTFEFNNEEHTITYIPNISKRENELGISSGRINHNLSGHNKLTQGRYFFRLNGFKEYLEKTIINILQEKGIIEWF